MSGATTFWRIAGRSYLHMAGTATTTVRTCLKQPMKDAALARDTVNYMRKLPPDWAGKDVTKVSSLAESLMK